MENKSVSQVLRELIDGSGYRTADVALRTGIKRETLYSIQNRESDRVSITALKVLADFFGEDLEIFCGDPGYVSQPKLTQEELSLVTAYRKLGQTDQATIQNLAKQPPRPLTEAQQQLLEKCGAMNDQGQSRLLETCEDMLASGRYKGSALESRA